MYTMSNAQAGRTSGDVKPPNGAVGTEQLQEEKEEQRL